MSNHFHFFFNGSGEAHTRHKPSYLKPEVTCKQPFMHHPRPTSSTTHFKPHLKALWTLRYNSQTPHNLPKTSSSHGSVVQILPTPISKHLGLKIPQPLGCFLHFSLSWRALLCQALQQVLNLNPPFIPVSP